ncbi:MULTISPECIES: DUF3006 domain-containing protein [Bacillus]|uniref:DUF3006 domain-containing protein n=1 Tax=Bacillus TaxID=1386 RepID=UPI000BB9B204|nr:MULTISPECIES: DUF3006 domain-containing protein [Bacillus]
MNVKGVLDRIVDGKHATILVEDLQKEFVIDVSQLPLGSKEGSHYHLTVFGEEITALTLDSQSEQNSQQKVSSQINRLKSKSKGSRFKRQ